MNNETNNHSKDSIHNLKVAGFIVAGFVALFLFIFICYHFNIELTDLT